MNELVISSEEQTISIRDGYKAQIKYNPFNRYWYYNLINPDGVVVAYGLALKPNTYATYKMDFPGLALVDRLQGDKTEYNPFVELGGRLMLVEL